MLSPSTPMWIADTAAKPVFFNEAMRDALGLTADDVLQLTSFGELYEDPSSWSPALPPDPLQPCTAIRRPLWHGRRQDVVFHIQQLRLGRVLLGYIGTVSSLSTAVHHTLAPLPVSPIRSEQPLLSIDSAGVLQNHIDAFARTYGPLMSYQSWEECRDLGRVHADVAGLCEMQLLAGEPVTPFGNLLSNMDLFSDINAAYVTEATQCEKLRTISIIKGVYWGGNKLCAGRQQMADWYREHGLPELDLDYSRGDLVSRLQNVGADAHLDDDPETWIWCLANGIPCFLMDRPWNSHIRTDLRVRDLETYMRRCGVAFIEEMDAVAEQVLSSI